MATEDESEDDQEKRRQLGDRARSMAADGAATPIGSAAGHTALRTAQALAPRTAVGGATTASHTATAADRTAPVGASVARAATSPDRATTAPRGAAAPLYAAAARPP